MSETQNVNNANSIVPDIPEWTAGDYTTTIPFDWLYEYKDNVFVMAQLREAIRKKAGQAGVKGFIGLWNAYLESKNQEMGIRTDNVTRFDGQPLELLCGQYICNDTGILTADKFGYDVRVCNHPIMPITRLVNVDTGENKTEIAFKRGNSWRTMVVDKNTLASVNKIVELSRYGVSVDSECAKDLVKYFTVLSDLNYDRIPEIKSVGRLGWIQEEGFSPYVDGLKFDGEISYKHIFESVKSSGDFNEWLNIVKDMRQSGSTARIVLATGFASVLVEVCSALPFFLHLWGGSGAGKTVGLMLAASVWADPSVGEYIHTFNSTTVGREMAAGFLNSLPLVLDELQVIKDRKEFDSIIYNLCEGVGRSRGAKSGGLQHMSTWHNCIITSGEMPISTGISGAGAVNRIIEIDCKDEKLFENPVEVVSVLKRNYGFAGKLFVDKLNEEGGKEHAIKVQKQLYEQIIQGSSTEKQSISASLILAADRLIEEWIFKDGQLLNIDDVAQYLTTNEQVSQGERCYEWIKDFITSNLNKFGKGDNVGDRWGSIEGDNAYFIKSIFDQKLKDNGYNSTAFLSYARRKDYIETDHERNTIVKRFKDMPSTIRVVSIKLKSEAEPQTELHDVDDDDIPF